MVKQSYSELKAIVENYEKDVEKTKKECETKIQSVKLIYDQCIANCATKLARKEALLAKWKKEYEAIPPQHFPTESD